MNESQSSNRAINHGALNDSDARRRISADHEHTLFVVAGAGTGKTTALVSRIVQLVASGHSDLLNLAAITFTEAAAGELRDRVRTALDRAARGDDSEVATEAGQHRCADARRNIDEAALCTLHAFAQRIIATAPLQVGVPPRFEVVDEIESARQFHIRWSRLLDQLLDDPQIAEAVTFGLMLGVRISDWRAIASSLHGQWDRIAEDSALARTGHDDCAAPTLADIDPTPILAAIDVVLALRAHCNDPEDKLLERLQPFAPLREQIANADVYDLIELLSANFPTANHGRQPSWDIPKSQVVAAVQSAHSARTTFRAKLARSIFSIVTPQIADWCIEGAKQRCSEGRLEFHDLLVLARDLLTVPATRTSIAARYEYLLIDEFQDTDPLQIELAMLLAQRFSDELGERPVAREPWHTLDVAPGRLFFVGDPKQSIYRFRRADLDLYHRVEHLFPEGTVALTQNFRSVPAIIEWVNATFEGVLTSTGDAGIQASPLALVAHRSPLHGAGPGVATFGEASKERAADLRDAEAGDVAAIVLDAVGNWSVYDPRLGCERPAQLRDIALLLPTRAALDALDRAFDAADITARIESRSLVFATTEVHELLAMLEAIHDPGEAIAVVASLRTPGFGCSDRALAEWSLAGGSWDYREPVPEIIDSHHPVALGMHLLGQFHSQHWWRSVSDTVTDVIETLQLFALSTYHRRPRDRWRRVQFLLHHARTWDDVIPGADLGGFVQWARQQAEDQASAVEVPVPEPDDDAVRVMTIHGSKGLEFPIVILAGVGASPAVRVPPVIFTPSGAEFTAGASTHRVETLGYVEARGNETAHEEAERARLLYVAATRARDHLIISRHHNATRSTRSPAAVMEPHIDRGLALRLTPTTPQPLLTTQTPTVPPASTLLPLTGELLDARFAAYTRSLVIAAEPSAMSATRIAQHIGAVANDETTIDRGNANVGNEGETTGPRTTTSASQPEEQQRPPWQRGRSASALGRAVHAVLQYCDLEHGTDVSLLADEQAIAEHIPHRRDEIVERVQHIRSSDTVRRAVRNRYWREVPVATRIDGYIIEGYIDLLFEHDGELTVVDYKTDSVGSPADVGRAAQRYAPQAATYAIAVERALNQPVHNATFIFATPTGAIEHEVVDLGEAKALVFAAIAAQREQAHANLNEPHQSVGR